MKKALSVIIAAISLLLVSCGKGASVSYNEIRRNLSPETVFADSSRKSFSEVLTYYDESGDESYSYSVCIYPSPEKEYEYNVIQSDGSYSLNACDGRVFAEKDGRMYSVILMSQTYREYVEGYLTSENDFDGLSFRQLYSKKSEGKTEVAYIADTTIAVTAKYSSVGLSVGDKIIATYIIQDNHITDSVTYAFRTPDGTEKPFLKREFSYSEEPQAPVLPSPDTTSVTLVFNAGTESETKSVFTAQKGCYLGISTGERGITLYTDPEMTSVFSPLSPEAAPIEGDITLYAKIR